MDGWGQRSEVRCAMILGLRKPVTASSVDEELNLTSEEEYEAELDNLDLDLSSIP